MIMRYCLAFPCFTNLLQCCFKRLQPVLSDRQSRLSDASVLILCRFIRVGTYEIHQDMFNMKPLFVRTPCLFYVQRPTSV